MSIVETRDARKSLESALYLCERVMELTPPAQMGALWEDEQRVEAAAYNVLCLRDTLHMMTEAVRCVLPQMEVDYIMRRESELLSGKDYIEHSRFERVVSKSVPAIAIACTDALNGGATSMQSSKRLNLQ